MLPNRLGDALNADHARQRSLSQRSTGPASLSAANAGEKLATGICFQEKSRHWRSGPRWTIPWRRGWDSNSSCKRLNLLDLFCPNPPKYHEKYHVNFVAQKQTLVGSVRLRDSLSNSRYLVNLPWICGNKEASIPGGELSDPSRRFPAHSVAMGALAFAKVAQPPTRLPCIL